jgi:DNA-binding response OmpR family regulator
VSARNLEHAAEEATGKMTRMCPRVLVVDDEPSIVRGLTYALERERFEVDVATDGETAVEKALGQAFDVVILDLMLPGLSGTDACRQIRAESRVPIIMLTAKDAEEDVVDGLRVGADDYMTKPFSAAELVGRVGAVLRRCELERSAHEAVRTVGGLNGGDRAITLARFEQLVAARKIHYYVSGAGPGGGGSDEIASWVAANFSSTTVGGATVYDLTS